MSSRRSTSLRGRVEFGALMLSLLFLVVACHTSKPVQGDAGSGKKTEKATSQKRGVESPPTEIGEVRRDDPTSNTNFPSESPGSGMSWLRLGPELLRVRVAAVQDARAKGLGGVRTLADDEGMIFLYPKSRERNFWMKDCLMDLDIAYAGADRVLSEIATLKAPTGKDPEIANFQSRNGVQFVLEMRAGWFAKRGIGLGQKLEFSPDLEEWFALVKETEGGDRP